MASRLKLQEELEYVLGSRNVYFQPPESVKINYDAIVYGLSNDYVRHADNRPYLGYDRYDITVISKNPDNNIAKRIKGRFCPSLPINSFRSLNHQNHFCRALLNFLFFQFVFLY